MGSGVPVAWTPAVSGRYGSRVGDDDMLAEIEARARRKARRRALITVVTIAPGMIVFAVFVAVLGFWPAIGMGAGLSAGLAILLENKVPDAEDE